MKATSMARDTISGQMAENITACGRIILCMAMVYINGMMEGCTKENIKTIRKMDTVSINGKMEGNMRASGRMESSMEWEYIIMRLEQQRKGNGIMELELNGSKIK